jgi:hypothetical protein
MNADKTLYVGGFGCHHEALNQNQLAFAFIGVHRRSSAVPNAFSPTCLGGSSRGKS